MWECNASEESSSQKRNTRHRPSESIITFTVVLLLLTLYTTIGGWIFTHTLNSRIADVRTELSIEIQPLRQMDTVFERQILELTKENGLLKQSLELLKTAVQKDIPVCLSMFSLHVSAFTICLLQ